MAAKALAFDCRDTRAVIFGGGTGLSTVVGGNCQLPDWPDNPSVGLKQVFPHLQVVVCTTDDGRSSGRLLQELPMIAIGDVRKSCLSLILTERVQAAYSLNAAGAATVVRLVHHLFNFRFPANTRDWSMLADPLRVAPAALRRVCPKPLASLLRELGTALCPRGGGPTIPPAGHALGNLLLTAAVFRAAGNRTDRVPGLGHVRAGLDHVARAIGAPPGRLHPATATPGQLAMRYANGVEVVGQDKSAYARRGFPVQRVHSLYVRHPAASAAIFAAVREADLIILAPGSLYTSIVPVLQLPRVAEAIRANRRALKVLGANFWIQEGETDISLRSEKRGFRVSELIEAYDQNVPGGADGLFQIVLSANLEQVPGSVLRNYALEGKRPIYLDRQRVRRMGLQPVEVTLFSPDRVRSATPVHHDPRRFALAVRALLYARPRLSFRRGRRISAASARRPCIRVGRAPLLCDYRASVKALVAGKRARPASIKTVLVNLAWENRDIRPEHFGFFRGAEIVRAKAWNRSTEWDNVLGYYDPNDRCLKLHEQLAHDPRRLRENLLIALGESLLGRYIASRLWSGGQPIAGSGMRCYEITLRPPAQRECFLSPRQLHRYLRLARMVPDRREPDTYRLMLNAGEGFLPSGLLFGLMYAWYLDNAYAGIMEYEMSLLRWPPSALIPHQVQEYRRKQALITFFRTVVFGHRER
ncbi:MAG: YvcK family protein [Kiritimatiellae bacterium]|nr:YvcK family protein [Kiritimatiellia bacterium]